MANVIPKKLGDFTLTDWQHGFGGEFFRLQLTYGKGKKSLDIVSFGINLEQAKARAITKIRQVEKSLVA